MMGLNFYTGLSISVLALAGYYFFVKEGKLPKGVVFVGEFLAISMCWCPTALLYNYLTYLLLGAGFVLLYYALTRKKGNRLCFVLAGICLGINVFVRFSNLANMALIVAVWAMGIIRKEKFGKVVQQTLWCVLGYTLGLGGMFGLISLKYGPKAYMDGVLRIQLCRGNLKEADRHMNLYMKTESGEELYPDLTVSWQEEVTEENVSLEEYYFVLSEEQLNTYTLWGEADIRGGCIHGDWSITFDLK